MADLSDVEKALVSFVLATLYPGTESSSSVTEKLIRTYRGWPQTSSLGLDLAGGISNVSVFSVPGMSRDTTRWGSITQTIPGTVSLSVSVTGNSATFAGVAGQGQVAGLLVDNQPFVYRGKTGDTPALVAAVLAQEVKASRSCWLSGSTVSVPGAARFLARTVADAQTVTEWARQEQGFRISAWCPDPMARDIICSALGAAVSAKPFLTLSDGTAARIRYRDTTSFDEGQTAQMYRRDLILNVEYATSSVSIVPAMLFGDLSASGVDRYA